MKIFYITFFFLFSTYSFSQGPCPGLDSINYSGQWYHTIQIGPQCWLKENLNIGKMILAVKDQTNNDTLEKFCYNNDSNNCKVYGGLYQWREAVQYTTKQGARGICPISWHIPLSSEFDTLISSVNGDGNSLKVVGQGAGTNTSGFSGLLGGNFDTFYSFNSLGSETDFWSSTMSHILSMEGYPLYIKNMDLNPSSYIYIQDNVFKSSNGISVRCLRDTAALLLQSPDGGENWKIGSQHNITWGGNNLSDTKIKLEFTTDNGINWITIINSIPAINCNYFWILPNTSSKKCKVKITDLNNPNSLSTSDSAFTIDNTCMDGFKIEHGGRVYETIAIGNQCWLKENLDIGTMLPNSKESSLNGIIEKYCYNDDTVNCNLYGGLYKYSEIGEKGICPIFWHIDGPSSFLDQVIYDGNAIKEIGQGTGFGAGTNTSGFSALFAGRRSSVGTFLDLGDAAWFPFTTNSPLIIADFLDYSGTMGWTDHFGSNGAGSIRCVMDDIGPLLLSSPVGGENWLIGSTQKISWTLSNVINIKIDYSNDNGSNWINIIPSTSTSAGSYNWLVPNTPSRNCKIKISSIDHPDTNSISNIFRIYKVSTDSCPGFPSVDFNGQIYNTLAIGNQCWLKENLNIGVMINATQDQSNNDILEKYCYNNDTNNCSIYGGLYQWDEAMQYSTKENSKVICPTGWHIPSWNEFKTLTAAVNDYDNDLIAIGQGSGTNATGFSALLSGESFLGSFNALGGDMYCWNSTNYDSTYAYFSVLFPDNIMQEGGPGYKIGGFSIRCINDSSVYSLPVELTSFTALVSDNNIMLNWNTETELNFYSFEIEKKIVINNNWDKIATIKASGNSTKHNQYSYIDNNVEPGKYSYRLKMIDLDGTTKNSKIIEVVVNPPTKFELSNAYPNPWNPTTTIRYQIPANFLVTIKLFNTLGKEVSTLLNEIKPAGNFEITLNAKYLNLSSGIYYYQMRAGNFIDTKKLILIK
ncbi:MAG: FISUMP domain-containing protein [Ignavibacteriaceae bacterium]|nr:FISUMP domain-containing protein [Ignavibacteriaceae bacterium]